MKKIVIVLFALLAMGTNVKAQKVYVEYNEFEKDTLVSCYFKSLWGFGVGSGAIILSKGLMVLRFWPSSGEMFLSDKATVTFLDDKGDIYKFKKVSDDITRGHLFYGDVRELEGKNLVKYRLMDEGRGSVERNIKKKLATAVSDAITTLLNKAKELNMVIREYEPIE